MVFLVVTAVDAGIGVSVTVGILAIGSRLGRLEGGSTPPPSIDKLAAAVGQKFESHVRCAAKALGTYTTHTRCPPLGRRAPPAGDAGQPTPPRTGLGLREPSLSSQPVSQTAPSAPALSSLGASVQSCNGEKTAAVMRPVMRPALCPKSVWTGSREGRTSCRCPARRCPAPGSTLSGAALGAQRQRQALLPVLLPHV